MLYHKSVSLQLTSCLGAAFIMLLAACSSTSDKIASTQDKTNVSNNYTRNETIIKKSDENSISDAPSSASEKPQLIPDAIPKVEPLRTENMRPYSARGKKIQPMTKLQPYKERGTASWYGRQYHGKATASGEIYDMHAMTAAHPTLPIPSYARVTNIKNGRSVIVRINDRGPFLAGRLIDLSYAAAHKLGALGAGNSKVDVEAILPDQHLSRG